MRILCPSCQKMVTLPDSAAGKPTPCPLCEKPFAPPSLTGAAIDAAPPPVIPPPAPEPRHAPDPPPRSQESIELPRSADPAPSRSGEPCCTCTIRKDVVRWLAPLGLFAAFVFSFFTWLEAAPNGTAVYTQWAWGAGFTGNFAADPIGDEVLNRSEELKKNKGGNIWLMLSLLALIPALILSIGDEVAEQVKFPLPDVIKPIWPHRNAIIGGLVGLMFMGLVIAMLSGFGLEKAALMAAEQAVPAAQPAADKTEPTPKEQQARAIKRDVEVARLGIRRTRWVCATFWAELLAVAGIAATVWLERRGDRPEPRVECYS